MSHLFGSLFLHLMIYVGPPRCTSHVPRASQSASRRVLKPARVRVRGPDGVRVKWHERRQRAPSAVWTFKSLWGAPWGSTERQRPGGSPSASASK